MRYRCLDHPNIALVNVGEIRADIWRPPTASVYGECAWCQRERPRVISYGSPWPVERKKRGAKRKKHAKRTAAQRMAYYWKHRDAERAAQARYYLRNCERLKAAARKLYHKKRKKK